ncbi:MAG TPA: hypothetical protein VD997_12330 [Phycisphaerales bacterium]|nr:hypothetical protein [Phycisphaerales bacterium]
MSSPAAAHHANFHHPSPAQVLRPENVTLAPTGRGMGFGLIGLGVVLAIVAFVLGWQHFAGVAFKQALAAYHLATMSVLAMSLGALFFVMVFHLTNAGWSATLRRQFENVAAFVPFAWLMVLPTLAIEIKSGGLLFTWLGEHASHSPILQGKWGYFFTPGTDHDHMKHGAFPTFFVVRALLYGAVWTYLSTTLRKLSIAQDTSGDRALSVRARFISSWGMLLFALSTAFASFDWLMSLDYTFFSTMWGVYYFAGAAYASVAVVAVILATLRNRGKMVGAVTPEHFHDIGKLMFTFTVFWAYIGFSQYFLIWYSNIPEETAFFYYRMQGQWLNLGRFLIIGHFVAPFLILLFRPIKRTTGAIVLLGLWAILMEFSDLYWIVRPMAYAGVEGGGPRGLMPMLVDALAILGVVAIFAGYIIQKIPQSNLIAIKDPRLAEALAHKNYV